ncbi:pantetheine-phosphate adenylyltransferase [Desulfonatronospira thiodismutans ASO3-1]|uniref:Phosphopantetheine adenylyltransferase n=1 Tax=Desulfonatronospira thiodismutans ASO3-1 TaxID=555779 RepID=D6SLU4_9BACT|nr:pantetheine-phosphate adenylyltransferase [Desulfonatronospira thiodismutans ASO3-1]
MAKDKLTAVYPGTFDPLTNGHVSLVKRGLDIFDEIVVAVALHSPKNPLFSLQERVDMVQKAFEPFPGVVGEPFEGLLIDYVRRKNAKAILRGMRAVADFEYEFQMALMNRRLDRGIQTIFLMTDYKWLYISSTLIKDVARLGGDITGLVPENVRLELLKKCRNNS